MSTSGGLEAVLGIGSLCVSRLERIHMKVTSGGTTEMVRDFSIRSLSDLPLAVTLPTSGSETGVNLVELTFYIRPKPGQKRGEVMPLAYQYADGSTGRVVLALSCVCLGVNCPSGEYCEESPAGSGRASCQPVNRCGDGICTVAEIGNCLQDCSDTCGNGTCDIGETCDTCPIDCACAPPGTCGNGRCDPGETCSDCPSDCCCTDACCKNQDTACCVSGCPDGSGGADTGSSGVGASGAGASDTVGVGASGAGASDSVGVGASGFGASGAGASGFGASGAGASDSVGVGASGAGASGAGASGFGASGAGASGFGASGFGASGAGASDSSGVGAGSGAGAGPSDSSGAGAGPSDSSGAGAGPGFVRTHGFTAPKRGVRRRRGPRPPSLECRSDDAVSR